MSNLRALFGLDSDGMPRILRTDTFGRIKTALAQPPYVETPMSAAGAVCEVDMDGMGSVSFSIIGTHNGTTVFEQTLNGVDWQPLLMVPTYATGSQVASATTTAQGVWTGQAPGAVKCRARRSAHTSGTAVVRGAASTSSATSGVTATVAGTVSTTPTTPTTTNYESAATTNATLISSSTSSRVYEVTCFNPTGATVYLKMYSKTTAPVVGTDTPIVTIPVPAGGFVSHQFGSQGKLFAGLGIALTAGALKTDTAAVGAGVQTSISRL